MMSGGFVVRFVVEDKSNVDSIHQAVKAVKNAGLATEKISESKVYEISKKDSCLYVCDPFEGKPFKHLLNHGCRIIGPQCVLSCLQEDVAIPKSNHPIYNICMRGVEISCSSIEKHDREKLHTLVQWMGGKVSRSFTETVTHLIAGEVGSKKYFVAADLKKPIMLPDWVLACWELSQGKHFVGTATDVIQEYSCPVFKGCNICVTGLDSEERNNIKRFASEHGGRYTGELKFKECTHLIVNVTGPKGQKYEFAKKWKIPCVTIKWFFDSIEKGSCQNEELYKAENSGATQDKVKSSTPKGGEGAPPRPPRMSSIADYSAISGNLSMMSTVNETAMTMAGNATMNGTTLISTTFEERALQGKQSTTADNMEELDDLNVSDYDGNLFLDGCKILLSGFSGNRLEKLRKIINAGGGTRFNQLNASVSHVIIGDKVQEHQDLLMQGKFRPVVVSAQWILDGLKQGAQVNEADYSVLDLPTALQAMSPRGKPRKFSKGNDTKTDDDNDATTMEGNLDDDVIAMYMDKQDENTTSTDSEITFNPKHEEDEDQDETRVENEDMDRTECLEQEQDVGIFSRKRFIIVGFPPEQESQIQEMITCQQGKILSSGSRCVADYAVVPVLGCPVESTVNEITTNCWLQMCIEMEQYLEPNSNALFTPIMLVPDALPLQGCVVSISQYAGVERDCLLHIAELLGATCQEYFVRKPNGILKANTHLLLKESEGSKYTAAKKWKIPAVTKEWLVECAKAGKRQPEANFSVVIPPQSSSTTAATTTAKNKPKDQPEEFKQPKIPSASKSSANVSKRTSVASSKEEVKKPDNKLATEEAGSSSETRNTGPSTSSSRNTDPSTSSSKSTDPSTSSSRNTDTSSNRNTDTLSSSSRQTRNSKPVQSEPLRRLSPVENDVKSDIDVNVDNRNSPIPSASNPQLQRIAGVAQKENFQTPISAARTKANNKFLADLKAGVGVDTPSKWNNSNFRPSFDLDDVNAFLDSPGTDHLHRKSRKSSLGLDDLLTANLAKAIANTADAIDVDQQESQSQDDSVFQELPPGFLDGVVICVSKKLSKSQGDYNNKAASLGAEFKWLYDESCTHFIFQGRSNDMSKEFRLAKEQGKKIVSPHWLFACEEQQCHVEESQFPHTYNPKLVLPVVSTKTPGRSALAKNTPARSTPARATRQSARRGTRQTRSSVKVAEVSPPPQPEIANDGLEDKDSTDSDEEMMRVTEAVEENAMVTNPSDGAAVTNPPGNALAHDDEGSLEMRENFQKQFEEIMTSTLSEKSGKRRLRRQASSTTSLSTTNDDSTNSGRRSRTKRVTLTGTEEEQQIGQKLDRPIESSQSVQITWDDPTSRKEREKIMAQLDEAGTQKVVQVPVDKQETPRKTVRLDDGLDDAPTPNVEDSPPTPTPLAPPIRLPVAKPAVAPQRQPESVHKSPEHRQRRPPKILLSGMSNEERVDYGALIEKLKGEVKDAQYFDPSCTHIVVGNPTRNEKFLASMASGKWVLHKSYLEACREQQVFVNEEDHEWGSATDLSSLPPQTAKLALAAHRWRCKLDDEREKSNNQIIPGAFDGWRVLLHVERARESGFKRLLQAGGAKILGMRPPFTNYDDATHAFFNFAKAKSSAEPVDLEAIVSAGVQCLKPEYIAQFLMEDPLPDPVNYVIKEVKPIIQRLGASYSEMNTTSTPTKRKRESTSGLSRSKKSKR